MRDLGKTKGGAASVFLEYTLLLISRSSSAEWCDNGESELSLSGSLNTISTAIVSAVRL
jgi:hypothetical protein